MTLAVKCRVNNDFFKCRMCATFGAVFYGGVFDPEIEVSQRLAEGTEAHSVFLPNKSGRFPSE